MHIVLHIGDDECAAPGTRIIDGLSSFVKAQVTRGEHQQHFLIYVQTISMNDRVKGGWE